jgi:MFS family permease
MAAYVVYILAAGLMTLAAAAPFALAHGPELLGVLALFFAAGALFVPTHVSDLLGDHYRTALAVVGLCAFLALLAPPFAFAVLVALLLLIRNRDFFGLLVLMSLFVLACGLAESPSYGPPALVIACMVVAGHARAARALNAGTLGIAGLMLWASLCAGGLLALLAPFGGMLPVPVAQETPRAPAADGSNAPLFIAALLLPVVGFLIVKHLHYLNPAPRASDDAAVRTEGRLEKDEALKDGAMESFAGHRTNAAVVKGYVRWRAQLASHGCRFVREDTAEEGASSLALRLGDDADAAVRRLTEIFNLARYGNAPLADADAAEFATLTRTLARDRARTRR